MNGGTKNYLPKSNLNEVRLKFFVHFFSKKWAGLLRATALNSARQKQPVDFMSTGCIFYSLVGDFGVRIFPFALLSIV